MPAPRTYQTEAVIIKKTKLGEADRVLTLYTPEFGKIQAIAKGVRRPKSKLAGHLELLTHSLVSLARGRNLDTITGSQTIHGFLPLKSDLLLSSCALYVSEMVNQFTAERMENRPVFNLLVDTLDRLSQPGDTDLILRYFDVQLLNEVGYRPELQNCVACKQPLNPVINAFSAGAGGVLCPECQYRHFSSYPLSVNALKVLRLFQNCDYATVSRLRMNPGLSHELESLLRHYVRYILERELKSAAWLDTLKAEPQPVSG